MTAFSYIHLFVMPLFLYIGFYYPNYTNQSDGSSSTYIFFISFALSVPSVITYTAFGYNEDGYQNKLEEHITKTRINELSALFPWLPFFYITLGVAMASSLAISSIIPPTYSLCALLCGINFIWLKLMLPMIRKKYQPLPKYNTK